MTVGIILAAGMGKRLKEFTAEKPKALVEVHGKPLIAYAIDHARAIGLERLIVVGGFHYEDLAKTVRTIDSSIELAENKEYEKQNLLSLNAALPLVGPDDSIFVINVDYIMRPHTLAAMKSQKEGFSVYGSFDLSGNDDDVMTIKVEEGNRVTAMSKTLTEFDAIYTGFWFVEAARMPGVRALVEELKKNWDPMLTTVEHIFREEIALGRTVTARDIGPVDWFEIDTPEELAVAENATF